MNYKIGINLLESITLGMYNDYFSSIREYIQNSVDSGDEAVRSNIITPDEFRIDILIDSIKREIRIKDNGTGVAADMAIPVLLSPGSSDKSINVHRGFRGIGRLGGLSSCDKLSFCTSFKGENKKTIITLDRNKLKALMSRIATVETVNQPDLQSAIESISDIKVMPEQSSAHYFIVKMEGVSNAKLLDIEAVHDYVSQVAPVPFSDEFTWGNDIRSNLNSLGVYIEEYPIFLGSSDESLMQVFKPYTNFLKTKTGGICCDEITNVCYQTLVNNSGYVIAVGWYAETNFSGRIYSGQTSGIRVRKGNIQIGDENSMASCFKEARFNSWVAGEIHVASNNLVPNSRRDNFEPGAAADEFTTEAGRKICAVISSKITKQSKLRNTTLQKLLSQSEKHLSTIEIMLREGFETTSDKDRAFSTVTNIRSNILAYTGEYSDNEAERKSSIERRIQTLLNNIRNTKVLITRPKLNKSKYSRDCYKILGAVIGVLSNNFETPVVEILKKEIMKELHIR